MQVILNDYEYYACKSGDFTNINIPGNWLHTVCVCSVISRVQLFATQWAVAYQAPLSTEFSEQEDWSGLPFLPPEDLPNPGTEPISPASPALQADSLLLSHWGSVFIPYLVWNPPVHHDTVWEPASCTTHDDKFGPRSHMQPPEWGWSHSEWQRALIQKSKGVWAGCNFSSNFPSKGDAVLGQGLICSKDVSCFIYLFVDWFNAVWRTVLLLFFLIYLFLFLKKKKNFLFCIRV